MAAIAAVDAGSVGSSYTDVLSSAFAFTPARTDPDSND
jgi:hypothetical protein